MPKKLTIQDVAAQAGVSTQTVSRVLNDRPDVAEDTRLKVQQVIEELGYRPNILARSLHTKRTYTLGLITADLRDYFFSLAVAGAEAEARKHGYYFLLCTTEQDSSGEPDYLRVLAERQVDGMLFIRPGREQDRKHISALRHRGIPIVITTYFDPERQLPVVAIDNRQGGYLATRYLLDAGHRAIGMITGPLDWQGPNDRRAGYHAALQEAGLAENSYYETHGDWSSESGYHAMSRLLEMAPDITAVFVHNDHMAIGAMHLLREAGYRVPDDFSVVGFDDIPVAAFLNPPLTTIRQPMQEVGIIAVRRLIQAINRDAAAHDDVVLDTMLIERGSVKDIR